MEKIDFKKTLAHYKAKQGKFELIQVPRTQYLMIDGAGDPNTSQEFADAISTLFPIAYKIKFASKKNLGKDYAVMPLEGLWWADDMSTFTTSRDKSQWKFTVMIMQPEWVSDEMFRQALNEVRAKLPAGMADKVRLESLDEGLCVQTLHVGSFEAETPVLAAMHNEFIPAKGLRMKGLHHEIYFSDFRKVSPSKLKTILRQPVAEK